MGPIKFFRCDHLKSFFKVDPTIHFLQCSLMISSYLNHFCVFLVIGGLSIAVPGLIRGFMMAHKRHGRLEWKDLFQPSIKMARKGVKIGSAMAKALEEKREMIQNDKTWW